MVRNRREIFASASLLLALVCLPAAQSHAQDAGVEAPIDAAEPAVDEPALEPTGEPAHEPSVPSVEPEEMLEAEPELAPTAVPSPPIRAPSPSATGDVLFHFEPGQGFQMTSYDGRFELIVRARVQLVAMLNAPNGGDAGIDFELRRARIYLQGAVFDPNVRFTLQLGVSPSCSDMGNEIACGSPQRAGAAPAGTAPTGFTPRWSPLLDWYVELRHLRELNVRIGQMIPTFSRTFTISDASYQFIDRSLADAEFNFDRDFALELRSLDVGGLGWLRYYAGIASNQGRDQPFPANLGLMYYARVDVSLLGFFADYVQGDLARSPDPRVSFGAAYAFLDRARFDHGTFGQLPLDGGTTDMHELTGDVVFMWHGFSLTGELTFRQGTRHAGSAIDPMTMMPFAPGLPRTGFGGILLAGYLLPDLPLEVVFRAGVLRRAGAITDSAITDQNELGGGLNWYIDGHPLKLTLWFGNTWNDALGIDHGNLRLAAQMQVTL